MTKHPHRPFFYTASSLARAYVLSVNDDGAPPAGGGSGGADAEAAINARIEAAVTERIARETAGLKAKNDELLGKLAANKDVLKSFEGLDPVQLKALKDKLDANEDLQLIAEGKHEAVINKHTQRMRDQHKADLEAAEARIQAEAKRADVYKGAVLENQIRAACAGLHPSAVEDALLHGRNVFQLDESGKAVKLDAEGRPELGKDGTTHFSPAEWIDKQRELKPHWFPAGTSGSGSSGARESGGGKGNTITRANFDALSATEKARVATSGVQIV